MSPTTTPTAREAATLAIGDRLANLGVITDLRTVGIFVLADVATDTWSLVDGVPHRQHTVHTFHAADELYLL